MTASHVLGGPTLEALEEIGSLGEHHRVAEVDDAVLGMWRRFARELGRFGTGLYLSDLLLGGPGRAVTARAFQMLLSSRVRRRVHTHFDSEEAAVEALRAAGFADARLHRGDRHPAAGDAAGARIHVVEATLDGSSSRDESSSGRRAG